MDDSVAKNVLKSLGISAGVVTGVIITVAAFTIYRTFLETKLTKLQITQAEKDLQGQASIPAPTT